MTSASEILRGLRGLDRRASLKLRLSTAGAEPGGLEHSMHHGENDHGLWESVAHAAMHSVIARQDRLIDAYGLDGTDIDYFRSLDAGSIVWSRGGHEFLRARLTAVGSVSTAKNTWLWSWANPSVRAVAPGDIAEVRRYGQEYAFDVLTTECFEADELAVTQAHMVAAEILAAQGIWRDRTDDYVMFFLLDDLTYVAPNG